MTVAKRNKRVKPDPELVKLANSLLANYQKPEDLIGENGLLKQLTKMLVERALEAEMSEHLGRQASEKVRVTRTDRSCQARLKEYLEDGRQSAWRRSPRKADFPDEAGNGGHFSQLRPFPKP
jgi:hypothetical protein